MSKLFDKYIVPADQTAIRNLVDYVFYLLILPLNVLGELVYRIRNIKFDYILDEYLRVRHSERSKKGLESCNEAFILKSKIHSQYNNPNK